MTSPTLDLIQVFSGGQPVLTPAELAKALGTTGHHIRQAVGRENWPIPYRRLGGRIIFSAVAVAAYLDGEAPQAPLSRRRGRPTKAEQIARDRDAEAHTPRL